MAELFTVMRYMANDQLERDHIANFDAWANMFGEVAPGYEKNAAGKYEIVERFAKFVNVPELMKRVRNFMDVLLSADLGDLVKRPEDQGRRAAEHHRPADRGARNLHAGELDQRIADEQGVEAEQGTAEQSRPDHRDHRRCPAGEYRHALRRLGAERRRPSSTA
jgi:N12 class adenine-specific DNA methylase